MISGGGNRLCFTDAKIALYVIPKAAITSIKRCVSICYMEDLGKKNWRGALHVLKHASYKDDYYKIAVVRNPWDRVASLYTNKIIDQKDVKPNLSKLELYHKMPFDEFIQKLCKHRDSERLDKHLKSQYLTVFRDGEPDFIARTETLKKDWKEIQKLFLKRGNKKINPLRRLNKSSPFKGQWTAELVDLIAERYETDIELLGYKGPKQWERTK